MGDGDLSTPVMGLKPVASPQLTPFPPPARVPRRAIHSIVTAPHAREIAPPQLLLENPNPEHGPLIEPHSVAVVEAPSSRVLEATLPVSTVVDAPIDGGDTPRPNDVVVKPEAAQAAMHDPTILREGGVIFSRPPTNVALADFIPAPTPTSTPHIYVVREVKATSNGFYFFEFKTTAAMEEVIEGGPWLFRGQPIVLQKWEPGMMLRKLQHTQVPVWIKLRHLPVELWTTKGLSTMASGIGKPLYPDAITRACTRLDFARVCVMLDISSKLPKHIVIMVPSEDGSESACKVDVEYEWLPPKCNACMSLGHPMKDCPSTKPKPPISVYVQKRRQRNSEMRNEYEPSGLGFEGGGA
ncbi:UNVERIFIED_CONTAM: hypothetical protein Slati_2210700 [Sesamum latifolium]|uniref:DUF4283 domain-containing protein n=1 Tax=Sesamum latifolium TaxID=2727402 RepID=A0AAW2WTC1_9LAMI